MKCFSEPPREISIALQVNVGQEAQVSFTGMEIILS